ncbi:MAG: excisionase family DNA-binding protein [Slackia sp.]|nr:excisionase family DNA-binding protein [Slackia sp.]
MERYLYEAIFTPFEGGYEVEFPELGLFTQGRDLSDAAYMAQDVLTMEISDRLEAGEDVPTVGSFKAQKPQDGAIMGIMALAQPGCCNVSTMTVDEAADILDVSRARIHALIKDGTLRAEKTGNRRLVNAEDVMARFNSPRHPGRPRKNGVLEG